MLELDHLVTEVLCNNPNDIANPVNTGPDGFSRNKFKTMSKYQIIKEIRKTGNGIFIDNDDRNAKDHDLCSNVSFIHATGRNLNRYSIKSEFLTFVSNLSHAFKSPLHDLPSILYDHTNLVTPSILMGIIEAINAETIDIVVSDFDGTIEPWRGAFPFTHEYFITRFQPFFNVKIE